MTQPDENSNPASADVAIIVPLLNEEPTLSELYRQLKAMADTQGYQLQIVFVDDGSVDGSWAEIKRIAATDPGVAALRFRRNFGKADALSVGITVAEAPIVVTIDADLQDDPAEIPKLISKLDDPPGGFDVVSGWKVRRQDPWHKTWPSLVFNSLVSWMTGVKLHDHNCGLKAYRREALAEVHLYGELHRFVPVLAAARGFRVTEVGVNHRPREHGVSKYGASRIVKGLLDLFTVRFLTGYGDRPQHALGGLGLLSFAFGSAGLAFLALRWVLSRLIPGSELVHLHETASLFYSLGFCLVGSQFLAVGLLGAMITAASPRNRRCSIVDRIGASTKHTLGSPENG